jgi:hypothetical protein
MPENGPHPSNGFMPPEPETPPLGGGRPEPAEDAGFRRLHPALRHVWVLGGLLGAVVVAVIAALVETIWRAGGAGWALPPYLLAIGLLVLLGVYAVVFGSWRYRAWRYAIRPHDVLLHYGVLWRMRRCIPRLRIQHVDIESGPIDRAFGMAKLTLHTAGTNAAVGTIPGLLPEDAEALRETLLRTEPADG